MAKKATAERIAKFKEDVVRLRQRHGNDAVGKKAKIHPTNLSSYVHGSKIPGETTINRLYMNFEEELNQPNDPNGSDKPKQPDQPKQPQQYLTGSPENLAEEPGLLRSMSPSLPDIKTDFIDFLKLTNERQAVDNERLWHDKALLEKDKDELRKENNWIREKFDTVLTNNTTMAKAVETIANKFDPKGS